MRTNCLPKLDHYANDGTNFLERYFSGSLTFHIIRDVKPAFNFYILAINNRDSGHLAFEDSGTEYVNGR